jgi:hypothetical protein
VAARLEEAPESRALKDMATRLRDAMTGELAQAIRDGNETRSIALLKAGADPRGQFTKGLTFLAAAAANSKSDTVKAILELLPEDERAGFVNEAGLNGNTALHEAAFAQDKVAYRYLIEAGGDAEKPNTAGETPGQLMNQLVPRGDNGRSHSVVWDYLDILFMGGYHYAQRHRTTPVPLHTHLPTTTSPTPTERPSPTPPPQETEAQTYARLQDEVEDIANDINQRMGRIFAPADLRFERSDGRRYFMMGRLEVGGYVEGGDNARTTQMRRIRAMMEDIYENARRYNGRINISRIHELATSLGRTISIRRGNDNRTQFNPATGAITVLLSGRDGNYDRGNQIDADWARPANSPSWLAVGHEFNHVIQFLEGRPMVNEFVYPHRDRRIPRAELEAVGLIHFAGNVGTENALRAEAGLPLRTFYGFPDELINGLWGGKTAREWAEIFARPRDRRDVVTAYENLQTSLDQGYEEITTEERYEELMSGDPGVVTRFSYDDEFKDIIRFHQEKDGEIINRGVIDRQDHPELAGRAQYERGLMDDVKAGKYGFLPLFELRFREGSGRPGWSPAATRVVDEWLKNAKPSDEDMQKLWVAILGQGRWSRAELTRVLDSGVADGEGLGRLKTAITALFYDQAPVPTKQQYEDALNALAVYIATPMQSRERLLPELNDEAKGYLAIVVKYHLHNFNPEGKDKHQSGRVVRYHFGDDYLFKDVPNLIADRVENVFGPGFEGDGANDVVQQWFDDKGSDAHEAMKEAILKEYDGYTSWANWLFGGPNDPRLQLIDWD